MNVMNSHTNKRLKTNETNKISDEKQMFEAFIDVICGTESTYDLDDQLVSEREMRKDNFESYFTLVFPLSSVCTDLIETETVKLRILNRPHRKFQLTLPGKLFLLSNELFSIESRRISISDYLLRTFIATLDSIDPVQSTIIPPGIDQFVLRRSYINISEDDGTVAIDFTVKKGNKITCSYFLEKTLVLFVENWITCSQLNTLTAKNHWQCVEDQMSLRRQISLEGVSFVANKSILPRAGGNDDRALPEDKSVPFLSPITLQAEFVLPHSGKIVGMLIPKGVTVITGGGYHGKSTILNAIKMGVYNKICGDGREFVVTNIDAIAIRSEDGRYVSGVDISPFIDNLPPIANIDPNNFSTNSASGSTSMSANIIEYMELNPELFLLDEDTCASNFMIRDSRMRSMISNEPITPFIYRVNSLHKEKGISTIVVIGGSGDWFDVQDATIMMDNYNCLDVTLKARSICKTFCTGRVQYNGRGLVHQLPWKSPIARVNSQVVAESTFILSSSSIGNDLEIINAVNTDSSVDNVIKYDNGSSIEHHGKPHHHVQIQNGITRSQQSLESYPVRCLRTINIPCDFMGKNSVYASEDGHFITFSGNSLVGCLVHDTFINENNHEHDIDDIHSKDRKIEVLRIDLSKLEQRVASQEGALGIALVVAFVAVTFNYSFDSIIDRDIDFKDSSKIDNLFNSCRTDSTNTNGNDIINHNSGQSNTHLNTLLNRFDALHGSWQSGSNLKSCEIVDPLDMIIDDEIHKRYLKEDIEKKGIDIDLNLHNYNQLTIDKILLSKIHREFMGSKDFIWPRKFEAAGAINRLRGVKFTTA